MRNGWFGRALIGGIFAGVTLWAFSLPCTAAEDPFAAMRAKRAIPPTSAPDLALPIVHGGTLQLADLRGKVVILGFFVTT